MASMSLIRERKWWVAAAFVLFIGLNLFLSMNKHSRNARYNYHDELWADRAGYFIYLPATFKYGWNVDMAPVGLDTLTGNGFRYDRSSNVIRTKYTSGVALLLAPIYLTCHAIGRILGWSDSGYGDIDHIVVDLGAAIYLAIGLALTYRCVRPRLSRSWTMLLLLLVYAGSNLFYYTVADPGMSHVYSFFLFATILYQASGSAPRSTRSWHWLLLGGTIGLAILVRPTNVLFVLATTFALGPLGGEIPSTAWLAPRKIILMVIGGVLIWVPQLIYWKYAWGSYVTWSYGEESFTNILSPKIGLFLFSTNNGLVPYAPVFALVFTGLWTLWKEDRRASLAISATLAMVILSGASWWVWHFGCGFGSRTLVEYSALTVIPLASLFRNTNSYKASALLICTVIILVLHQLKMVYSYGDCWFHGDWNWEAYWKLVFGPTK